MVKLRDGRQVDLELFKFDTCPFCILVLNKLRQLGVEGVRIRDTVREPGAEAELVRRGGMDQVPCLFIDGQALYESSDIVEWMEQNLTRDSAKR